jgi:cell division protein FtsI/penicillin-binding protein 2
LPQLAEILQVPEEQLSAGFDPRKPGHHFSRRTSTTTAVAKLRALKLDSLIFKPHDRRFYPNNELAPMSSGLSTANGHGLAGMEKEMDKLLSGVPGERLVERDAKKHEIAAIRSAKRRPVDGDDVTLTIKTAIQHVVEDSSTRSCKPINPTPPTSS